MDPISMAIFKLPEHQRILQILQSLDAQFLTDCNALFGGGTLVSLSHGEFRVSKDRASVLDSTALISEQIDGLSHSDAYVRARSAALIAQLPLSQVSDFFPLLERLLTDEEVATVGIVGRVELHGRLHHWHQQWWSPRVSAIQVLLQFGKAPEGEQVLRAMVAESKRPAMICSSTAPHQFSIAQWRQAVTLAGGLAVADPIIRSARQQCLNQRCSKDGLDNSASAAEAELAEVIRQLSGRLL
jgi:hypothetical protein